MAGEGMSRTGGRSEVASIRRLILKRPQDAFVDERRIEAQWRDLRFTARPDLRKAAAEHERFAELLCGSGGAILCNMGKAQRRHEPRAAARYFEAAGIPIAGRIEDEGRLEGGDVVFLDARTVAVGQGYRTNGEGIRQLREILGGGVDDLIPVPLPHWSGPDDVLHLMSLLSPIDIDLLLAYSRLLPAPFRQWLLTRGTEILEVPDEEFASMGCNVLATAPGRCIMLQGNPRTRRLLETAGCEVTVYEGREISLKGSGGPTCQTRPLVRE